MEGHVHRFKVVVGGGVCLASICLALVTLGAHTASRTRATRGWWQARGKINLPQRTQTAQSVTAAAPGAVPEPFESGTQPILDFLEGRRLFERETFGGNGRTCLTCHSRETGTVSPQDARLRFRKDKDDPLFVHDGSDDDNGDGFGDGRHATRMLANATVLMRIRLHPNVEVKDHPEIQEVTVPRGIPTTLNTPALDPVLMLDGRQPTLQDQALGAITDHAQATRVVTERERDLIARFQQTPRFFSSPALALFAFTGSHPPGLPRGGTDSESGAACSSRMCPPTSA
jgi:Di-haem cytochrome c peroxidase